WADEDEKLAVVHGQRDVADGGRSALAGRARVGFRNAEELDARHASRSAAARARDHWNESRFCAHHSSHFWTSASRSSSVPSALNSIACPETSRRDCAALPRIAEVVSRKSSSKGGMTSLATAFSVNVPSATIASPRTSTLSSARVTPISAGTSSA